MQMICNLFSILTRTWMLGIGTYDVHSYTCTCMYRSKLASKAQRWVAWCDGADIQKNGNRTTSCRPSKWQYNKLKWKLCFTDLSGERERVCFAPALTFVFSIHGQTDTNESTPHGLRINFVLNKLFPNIFVVHSLCKLHKAHTYNRTHPSRLYETPFCRLPISMLVFRSP